MSVDGGERVPHRPGGALSTVHPGPLAGFHRLMHLSSRLFGSHDQDEILGLVARWAPEVVPGEVEACYLATGGRLLPAPAFDGASPSLATCVARLGPAGGALDAGDGGWRWGFPLRSMGSQLGYLVLRCDADPSADERFLMEALCQQVAAAMASASLHRGDREHVAELRRINDELTTTISRLEQRTIVHEVLTRASASGEGEAGIARAVHTLTGLPVAIEDAFGNLRQWAGLPVPGDYPKPPAASQRQAFVTKLIAHAGPLREHRRIISLVRPRGDVLGVLVLLDDEHSAGDYETFVVEYATTVLALELAHQRSLAEVELRVHRDLVADLISGTDDESAFARAAAIGHDLHAPHRLVAVRWRCRGEEEAVASAARRAFRSWERRILVSRHAGVAVLLIAEPLDVPALYGALAAQLGTEAGAIGVGGRCSRPAEVPRSYAEARQALAVREESASPYGATTFEDLGVYRILGVHDNRAGVEDFMREWLGPLLDYDDRRHAQLVRTLFEYLECGGNYDRAADSLVIHRSTLRYRLARIREIGGFDLSDVDTRLNLQIATRAWQLLHGDGPRAGA
ncbi:PucR family transcriptional regulator [Amycolatopsis taiwanensis]|uniref:Transcriptional regulator n=1 Tax=Amycolatopsis taiwanensis TaxID=342230 RepID=A0A9W6VIV6_9PSEU|nr:helix-turn-helix domain-containing protein [Amycolatopsis taiwanensis]GLY68842.1 hypothetical protein Atai01_54610 [Amycolatopsis taiwanensis]